MLNRLMINNMHWLVTNNPSNCVYQYTYLVLMYSGDAYIQISTTIYLSQLVKVIGSRDKTIPAMLRYLQHYKRM